MPGWSATGTRARRAWRTAAIRCMPIRGRSRRSWSRRSASCAGRIRKWGPKRLVFEMGRRGLGTVTRSTVYRVLVRNQLIEPRSRRRRRQDYMRWERRSAMQLWQLDVTASAFLADGTEVKIVTGIDDHSRYCVIAKAVHAGHRPAGLPGLHRGHDRLRGARGGLDRQRHGVYRPVHQAPPGRGAVRADLPGERHHRTGGPSPGRRPPRGRSSGCTSPCKSSCWTCTARSRARGAAGRAGCLAGRSTTPTGRTSRWAWPSPPPGSPRRSRRCRCGSRPSYASTGQPEPPEQP